MHWLHQLAQKLSRTACPRYWLREVSRPVFNSGILKSGASAPGRADPFIIGLCDKVTTEAGVRLNGWATALLELGRETPPADMFRNEDRVIPIENKNPTANHIKI